MNLREWIDVIEHNLGRGLFPHQTSFTLVLPLRRLVLSPEQLADRLHLNAASQVLEVGPGPGYFGIEIARRLSQGPALMVRQAHHDGLPKGRLELFDLQPEMLEQARRRLETAGLRNVGFTQGDACNLPYSENQFDVVFLVAVLGEVADPAACLQGIYRTLRPAGLLSITEQPGDPDFVPLPIVRALAEQQGFRFVESYGRGKNYTANFEKEAQNAKSEGS